MSLSNTARTILTEAGHHPLGLVAPPATLPAAARHAVLRSLLRQGLVTESAEPLGDAGIGWRQPEGTLLVMQITDAGRQAIGAAEPGNAVDGAEVVGLVQAEYDAEQDFAQRAPDAGINPSVDDESGPVAAANIVAVNDPTEPHSESLVAPTADPAGDCGDAGKGAGSPSRTQRGASREFRLRKAAQAVLAAWVTPEQPGLAGAIDVLQAALISKRPVPEVAGRRTPRPDTKQAAVLALLRRPEGASGPQIIEATGWAPHTVRGFLAGLGRKGIAVSVLERVRPVGPNKAGAKGSYSIYRIAEAG